MLQGLMRLEKNFTMNILKRIRFIRKQWDLQDCRMRMLQDIVVVVRYISHQWEQQFSGYTSPSFKGFWLPRSLLYGYFWYVTNEEYKSNYKVNKKMEDVMRMRLERKKIFISGIKMDATI